MNFHNNHFHQIILLIAEWTAAVLRIKNIIYFFYLQVFDLLIANERFY